MSSTEQPLPPAGLARRLAALFYDALLLLAIAWGVTAAYVAADLALTGNEALREYGQVHGRPLLQLLLLSAVVVFCCYFWLRSGQTLGMQSWRLCLVSVDREPLRLRQCLLRCAAAALSIACLGCGYWWALIDRKGRSWHDRLSATEVLLLPKTPR